MIRSKFVLRSIPLHLKITILVCVVTVVVTAAIGVLNYQRVSELAHDRALEKLAGETRLIALQLDKAFESAKKDLLIVSRTPPIQGIVRSLANQGEDTLDNSSTDVWRQRLEEIFMSIMKERPFYMQMRYIGALDGGMELVRVNRLGDQLIGVNEAFLQQKGREPYMQNLDELEVGEMYFSDVTLNREFGKVDNTNTPMLRALTLVRDGNDLFGVLIVNIDYPYFIKYLVKSSSLTHDMFILNDQGDYLKVSDDGRIFPFEFHENYSTTPPDIIAEFKNLPNQEASFEQGNSVSYCARLSIANKNRPGYIGAVLQVPYEAIMGDARDLRNRTIYTGAGLVFVSAILALIAARRFAGPLRHLTRDLQRYRGFKDHIDIPKNLSPEIKELGMALNLAIQNLRESEAKANAILDTANDGVITINDLGEVIRFNNASSEIFGYAPEEVIGQNVKLLIPGAIHQKDDQFVKRFIQSRINYMIGKTKEVKGLRKDGSVFLMELSLSEVEVKNGRKFAGIIRDLTFRKEVEETQRQLISELEKSNRDLDEFAYVASHDLKAPLRVIDNASMWLQEDLEGQLDEESQENLKLLRNRVLRMEKLLDDLLDYSKVGRKTDSRYNEVIEGEDLLEDILGLLNPPDNFLITADDAFKAVKVNRMPIQQILYNLINNAIKHHDKPSGKVEVSLHKYEGELICKVSDDGAGIDPQYHDKIFQIFQTLKPRDKVEGSGMGLSIIKRHVEQYHGRVEVESKPGLGSVFWFTMPPTF